MTSEPPVFALRARWVFPIVSAPIMNGCVTVQGERIVSVGASATCSDVRNLGEVAILPGLVNAHTHLEFSDRDEPLGSRGGSFTDWIRHVVSLRREQAAMAGGLAPIRAAAVAQGLSESLSSGTSVLGEIASLDWPRTCFQDTPLRAVVFQELLGLRYERSGSLLQLADDHVALAAGNQAGWTPGLSPHAPYTVRLDTVGEICRLARQRHVPVAMHLAESPEELQLLAAGSGPFVDLLEDLEAWDSEAIPRRTRPLNYLKLLTTAPRTLVIHGNYLTNEELDFTGSHRDRMSIVYCPRTHAYFDHPAYPLRRMLGVEANVCLGTDSRASNPDLSVWEEMRFAVQRHPDVSPAEILRMGTVNGARALGLGDETGVLVRGRPADMTLIQLSSGTGADPFDALFAGDSRVTGSYPPSLL